MKWPYSQPNTINLSLSLNFYNYYSEKNLGSFTRKERFYLCYLSKVYPLFFHYD